MAEDTPTASAPAGEERAPDTETKPVVAAEAAPETSQEKEAEKEKPSGKLYPDGPIFLMPFLSPPGLGLVVSSTTIHSRVSHWNASLMVVLVFIRHR